MASMTMFERIDGVLQRLTHIEMILGFSAPQQAARDKTQLYRLLQAQSAVLQRLASVERKIGVPVPFSPLTSPATDSHSAASSMQAREPPAVQPPTTPHLSSAGVTAKGPQAGLTAPAVQQESDGPTQRQLRQELTARGAAGEMMFIRAPSDYYERDLQFRRQVLGADSIQQLCKSLVLENTKARNAAPDTPHAARYFCVVIQYAARLHAEKVRSFLHKQSEGKLGRKQFNMRLAAESEAHCLTGYGHNAVTPIGMAASLPILLSHHIAELPQNFFWMGGGEVDLKLGMTVSDFVKAYNPMITDCTHNED